jgi:hypothetical protein
MRHCVNDIVDPNAHGERRTLFRVTRVVGIFPGVPEVGIVSRRDHEAALIVVDAAPVRSPAAIVAVLASVPQVVPTHNLKPISQVIDRMKDLIVIRDVFDRTVGENEFHGIFEYLPFNVSMVVVREKETSPKQVFAHFLALFGRETPFAHLDRVEPGKVEFLILVEVDRLLGRTDMNAGQTPHGLRKMAVGTRVVLRPQGHAQPEIAIEAAAITIIPAARKHQARKGEFGLFLSVRRSLERIVFNTWILPEWLLERVKRTRAGEGARERPRSIPEIHPHSLALRISSGKQPMLPFQFFRFLLPMQNPMGFGASDFIGLGLAAVLVAAILCSRRIESLGQRLAKRTAACMAFLAAAPIALRLALLGTHPVPIPRVADDFSYLLLGDTLSHFRLANPMHPMHRFFEAVFVLQQPSYSSIYPLGQGLVLGFGELFLRHPWSGVVLSVGVLCALCYWMLRAWTTPGWALTGGLLAAIEFGPLSPWMNTYWGGAVSGIAGCLVFGALPRLREQGRTRDAVLLGSGLALQLLTRPYEFVLLLVVVLLFFVPGRSLMTAALVLVPAIGLTLLQNQQVTGSWTTLPYTLSRYQYGVPTTFTFQPNPIPHSALTPEQQVDYDAQSAVHGNGTETVTTYVKRLGRRIRFYRFFFLAPLYLALPAFLPALRQYRWVWVALTLFIFWAGEAFYPYFYPHYIAAVTCLFVLVSVKGLERLSAIELRRVAVGHEAAMLILLLCLAHFVFWYGLHFAGNENLMLATSEQEGWDSINYGDREGRIAIHDRLAKAPGRQLVFVSYSPRHGAQEWIQNEANIDRARVVWALDLGRDENEKLRRFYPDRQAWVLEADARPPKITACFNISCAVAP